VILLLSILIWVFAFLGFVTAATIVTIWIVHWFATKANFYENKEP